jgi:glyoxylase-like metal-dependent hydrolase (beta-lactamase superfamily II)
MPAPARKREVGRGERTLPGVWRLRLPLPWPGIPHCNAWAVAAGDGVVLFDTGLHENGSLAHLERALDMVGLRLEHIRLVVCTHAHIDHCGEAPTIVQRAGCELWMHPDHGHLTRSLDDPEAAFARRMEIARSAGVPEEPLRRWSKERAGGAFGVSGDVRPDRDLVEGTTIDTDLGAWEVVETPGHAPSHVCLWQPERRLLISGDHVLGRVSLYYDFGYTRDPAGEFLTSLDRVDALGARLCLPGHGRTFGDVAGHVEANRDAVRARVAALEELLRADGPMTAFETLPRLYDGELTPMTTNWWLGETLCYLRHLEVAQRVASDGASPARWSAVGA